MDKKFSLAIIMIVIFLSACRPSAPAPTETLLPPAVPTETQPPTQTALPPTDTPAPTETALPTETLVPTLESYAGPPRIVFASNRGGDPNQLGLFLMDLETFEITPINTGLEVNLLPKWSPEGNRILFSIPEDWHLFTVLADGSQLTQLTDFRSNNADWSPDGMQIVFQSDHQNEPEDTPDIYIIDLLDENLLEILDDPDSIDYNPRWSPDGSKILFVTNRTGKHELFTMNIDGADLAQLMESEEPVTGAEWSPDGSKIAFTAGGFGLTELYVVDADGSANLLQLTDNDSSNQNPTWSPDGGQIIFSSNAGGNWDLWIVDRDGANLVQLTDDAFYDNYPDWCPEK